ncbi:aminoadipate-semialdehyde dehydrogenase [Lentinula aciculospora]|uniref:Alpha-aminoadipate reductase n=1 Tax=Lentinula aciculospora TaxID=153920 RepID=A0A9W8ZYC7_9AGAR|nr:aminoadipate-semialdehyde dehydrogenase [Lentinula aciculospora]
MNPDETTKLAVLPTDYPRTSNQVVEAEERYQINANVLEILRALVIVVHRYTGDTHIVLGAPSSVVHVDLTPEDTLDSIQIIETESLSTGDLTVFVSEHSVRTVYNTILFTPLRIQLLHLHLAIIIRDRSVPIGRIYLRTEKEEGILPDPCAPLNWCQWPGPITSVFSNNAAKNPAKAAIITQTKTHSYASLLQAANSLSNHLLKNGVARGDVVMIYAHRSADLVLAVLGTLGAGATFSVIDPAYPPERQIVYLSVARPRAVIILQGAQEVNPVDESVRGYWEKNLDGVKVCIEGVSLGEDGTVHADGSVLDMNTSDPGVVLGPDSIATLSFTSGSTGIPKGVRGRHYSLTHFFPWMASRFSLGPESRFTMLSGIAHDPIQRDIFTPLFLGASLHVPPSSAIGTPGALAAWMDEQKVTVTHLTPAMGQLVTTTGVGEGENNTGVAPSIPSLRTAFFVGDLLTKRDVARLQALARNVVIVNMYGTTETQRAVSYHAIPPLSVDPAFLSTQKEVIPAGKGMKDVQLLVVNRNDKSIPCAVGEPGEIYVRSGGLAEGYLVPPKSQADGESDPNEEKFVRNWFRSQNLSGVGEVAGYADTLASSSDPARQYWHGVRDRMYRSGDLGRYDTEGGVECIGRADNQIKIRGFRIELGEVDTHLAAHPGVRENVTLVRRDKDEEKMLVSYFVPLKSWKGDASELQTTDKEEGSVEGGIRRYAPLIKDIRAHLKKKLPGYSIPTLIIPLARMPLNPNGKIDKPALPFPDTAAAVASLSAVSASALAVATSSNLHADITPTQKTILKLFASLLPGFSSGPTEESLAPIPLNESFFDLGGHSILATRLVFEMRRAFPVLKDRISLGVVYSKHGGEIASVRGLASIVDVLRGEDLGLPVDIKEENDAKELNGALDSEGEAEEDNLYARDLDTLISTHLASSYPSRVISSAQGLHVFLTGATGFLGAFILQQLLQNQPSFLSSFVSHVTCLIRASSASSALDRLRDSCASRGVWSDSWVSSNRLTVLPGDLALPHFGVTSSQWHTLGNDVDVIMHNGALVHWVYPYQRLKAPNVMGTLTAVELAGTKGKPKALVFVSSTSVLDTPSYVRISSSVVSENLGSGVLETDDLETARRGLKTGYGQSKWVAEKLLFEAGKRGLSGYIIRPGYVVGESNGGVTNTDDFVWRMVKGCVQLGSVPDMSNGVNMVPVDRVAMCCVRAVTVSSMPLNDNFSEKGGPGGSMRVMHVTARPLPTFNDLFTALKTYGWTVEKIEYVQWRLQLEAHVMNKSRTTQGEVEEDNALYPLLHFVLDDLPTSTKAPMLDDRNTVAVIERGGVTDYNPPNTVDEELMGRYFAWLVRAGFLPPPQGGKNLPELEGGVIKAAGRSGI